MTSYWTPTDTSLFFSKKDVNDPRLGEFAKNLSTSDQSPKADLVIWGYPDHEGIQLNGGRIGAAEAPQAIRRSFYKMTPHVLNPKKLQILDAGDIDLQIPLKDRHDGGALQAQRWTANQTPWVSLGGGHDYGYADGAGFLRAMKEKNQRPVVINFDAHLDVRPADKNLNSGTPFFRLLSEFPNDFDFIEFGLQGHCNSRAHWDWALAQGAKLVSLDEIRDQEGLLVVLQKSLAPFTGQPLWVSLDMDAITSTEAPGCSQSWTTGLKTEELMISFEWLMQNFSWKAFSIYEVSPPLDSDLRTAKLAAQFLHHFMSLLQRTS